MVEMAENWEKVPEQQKCSKEYNGGRENKTRKLNLFFPTKPKLTFCKPRRGSSESWMAEAS